ncbi:MAG: DNRLRE domain-containing protein, partial [Planctomycetota bacterium]|nr:DNRLRE domain-containing protein [Planctomycetota bacterium]
KDHPKAVLVMLRDGQKGYDPAKPDKAFAGWEDAGTPSHLPMSLTLACFANAGKSERIETCFRSRPGFLRVDLSSIPKGATILSARLVVVRAIDMGNNWQTKPTVFVAEPCKRPWKEYEVNVFEYASGKFWNDYAGLTWGDDGDCMAVFLAHGPSAGKTLSLDFTQAVKYWTDGKHANQGFILHGSPKYVDYLNIFARECKEPKNRPGLAVVYEPNE